MAKEGRGRLSSIELLPPEADEAILWAADELRKREKSQLQIHEEFNARLADLGIGSISKSAFNRHSMKLAYVARRMENTREITKVLTDKLVVGQEDDLTIMTAELIKTLVFELLNEAGEAGFSPKQAMEMAAAIKSAAAAQHISSTRRQKLEEETENKVDEAIEQVSKVVTGLTKERASEIRKKVLGVRNG